MESFEQLAEQYTPMIHRIINCLQIYKNKEEFFQSGLIALWEATKSFNPDKGSFTSYAFMCIKGHLLKELTANNKHYDRNVAVEKDFLELVEDTNADPSFSEDFLVSHCQTLTPNQKKWVLYTAINDLSIKQIAHRENVSVSAVKQWRAGAREKLKDLINIE